MDTRALKEQFCIKELDESHLEQFNKLLRYAFQVTERDLLNVGWSSEEIKLAKSPVLRNARVFGWFDEHNLISQIALYPMQINIYNVIYKMGGITGVATYPEYSGIGLMNDLIKKVLGIMRECGQSISCLYPYSIPYYRSKGWEIVSDKITFAIKDSQVPKVPKVGGIVRRVSADNKDFLNLYHTFALGTHGALLRDSLSWEEYWRWEVEDISIALYYDAQGRASGYIVYGARLEIVLAHKQVEHWRYYEGAWHLLGTLRLKPKGKINAPGGTQQHWAGRHKALVESLFAQGYRLRYSGGMVPDLHQILIKGGGLFSYPATQVAPEGKLRKLFEVFPFAFVYECAGGEAIDGSKRLLELDVGHIHDSTPCFFGSSEEIAQVRRAYSLDKNA